MHIGPLCVLFAANVIIQPETDHLKASFKLDEPATTYEFAANDTPQRSDAWEIQGEGWLFDGKIVKRTNGEHFSEFLFHLNPDPNFHDRRYVVTNQIGNGWALYLAALGGREGDSVLKFQGFKSDSILRLPGFDKHLDSSVKTNSDDRRVAYIGPSSYVDQGSISLIAGPEVPTWVLNSLSESANKVAEALARRFGRPPVEPPAIIVSYAPVQNEHNRKGGTLDGATILVNIASDHSKFDAARSRDLSKFAAHEVVHLWINEVWDTTENNEKPWLHEGAAEYIADRLTLDDDTFREEASKHIQGCFAGLRGRSLEGSTTPIYGQTPYDCGFTIQFLAELSSLKKERRDILDIWNTIVATAPDGKYDAESFLKVASKTGGRRFEAANDIILNTQGDLKPFAFGEALQSLGVSFTNEKAGPAHGAILLKAAFMEFLRSVCKGTYGYYTEPTAYRLSADTNCGPQLSSGPSLTEVNGISLTKAPFAAYQSIKQSCDEHGQLTFRKEDGVLLDTIQCDANIAEPSNFATLAPLPRLPELASD